ncbi:hypothetical protein ACHAXT_000041 [Thalassiosira profunda]
MGRKKGGKGRKKSSGKKKKSRAGPRDWDEGDEFNRFIFSRGDNELVDDIDTDAPLPLGIGARVEINEFDMGEGRSCKLGTIIGHWVTMAGGPKDGEVAPYCVRLDGGWQGMVMADAMDCVVESDAPPLRVAYSVGSRVECKLEGSDEWHPGTVANAYPDWVERRGGYPYMIAFDNGSRRPFWGPQDCIRTSSKALPRKKRPALRFKVGDRVRCRVEEAAPMDGTVIKLWYRQKAAFADGHIVPYQIQLDVGAQIYAPADDDECIKRSDVPPPSCWICFDNEMSENNLIVRDCHCRGEENGFVHVKCLVKLAKSKVEEGDPDSIGVNPFTKCITCKQRFTKPSLSGVALAKAYYEKYKGRDLSDVWNRSATAYLSQVMVENVQHDQASGLLKEKIVEIRSAIKRVIRANVDTSGWMEVLATFLMCLADVYDDMGSLSEMKRVLDEAQLIIDEQGLGDANKMRAKKLAASHAYNSGDTNAALGHLEEALAVMANTRDYNDISLLLSCGNTGGSSYLPRGFKQ